MNLQAHVQRATNRAAILANLASGGSGVSKHTESPRAPEAKADSRPQRVTDQLFSFLGLGATGGDEKTKRGIAEQLDNKSIVLDNTKAQIEASKSSTRLKRKLAREKTTSNTFLKKRKLLNPKQDKFPLEPLQELNRQWRGMIAAVAKECSTLPQLQARVGSCTLIGAFVTICTATSSTSSLSPSTRKRRRPNKAASSHGPSFDDPYPLLAPAASTPATSRQLKRSCGFITHEGPSSLWVRTTTGAMRRFSKADHVVAAYTGLASSAQQAPYSAPFRAQPDAGPQSGLLLVVYGSDYVPFALTYTSGKH
jgi:hypothetical protein